MYVLVGRKIKEVAKEAHPQSIIEFTNVNRAGEGRYGETSLVGDIYDPASQLCIGHEGGQEMSRINAAARRLIEYVIPQKWRTLMNNMSTTDIETWRNNSRKVYQHCIIKSPKGKTWTPLSKATYKDIYTQMIAG